MNMEAEKKDASITESLKSSKVFFFFLYNEGENFNKEWGRSNQVFDNASQINKS